MSPSSDSNNQLYLNGTPIQEAEEYSAPYLDFAGKTLDNQVLIPVKPVSTKVQFEDLTEEEVENNVVELRLIPCLSYNQANEKYYAKKAFVGDTVDFWLNNTSRLVGVIDKIDGFYGLHYTYDKYEKNAQIYTEDGRLDYQRHWMAYIGERLVSCYIDLHLKPLTIERLKNNGFYKPYQHKD